MRTIVYGDLHGCIEPLWRLLDLIGPARSDQIISIGDFVDRGPDSPACVDFVRKHKAIMGNHEYRHVRVLRGIIKKLGKTQRATRRQFEEQGRDYNEAVEFMERLPFFMELPEAILVHAAVECSLDQGIPLAEQDRIVLIGGRSRGYICDVDRSTGLPFWCARYPKSAKPVIFGHLTMPGGVRCRENLFGIDTGCIRGEKLTAVTLPDFHIYQVPGYRK